jgi:hypothetical protein
MSIRPGVLKEMLDEGGISYKQNSKSFVLSCPRCLKPDKVYLRKSDGRFICFVCAEVDGFRGSAEWLLTELLNRSVSDIKTTLYGFSDVGGGGFLDLQLQDFYEQGLDSEPTLSPMLEMDPDPGFRELDTEAGAPGRLYLEKRGVPVEIAKEYGIWYWPQENRIVFPVKSGGKLLGWQDRYCGRTEYYDREADVPVKLMKAMTTPGLKRDRVLLFGDRLKGDHAVLCEGPFDALAAHLCGGNVATMGKIVSNQQLQLLKNSGIKRLYLALDPDAYKEAAGVLKVMIDDIDVYDMRPPAPYEDIGAMPMAAVVELMASAPRIDRNYLFLYLKDFHARA